MGEVCAHMDGAKWSRTERLPTTAALIRLSCISSRTGIHHCTEYCRFSVDDIPIRVFKNNEARGVPNPGSQCRGIFSSLWEGDNSATRGGLEKIDWSKAPFVASYMDFEIDTCQFPGNTTCASDTNNWWEGLSYRNLSTNQARLYKWVRMNYMTYDYCTDRSRYPVPPMECTSGI